MLTLLFSCDLQRTLFEMVADCTFIHIFVVFAAQKAPVSSPLSCLINTCQNGGICYRITNRNATADYCPDGFVFYSNFCYKLYQERKSWYQASKECSRGGSGDGDGKLVSVRDMSERSFVENFARRLQNMTGER